MSTGDVNRLRGILAELRAEHDAAGDDPRWDEAITLTRRSSAKRARAKVEAVAVTPEICAAVLAWHARSPETSIMVMARRFGINPGRVSEIISGERDPATGRMRERFEV